MHLQPAAKNMDILKGDFPVCEKLVIQQFQFPVHEFVNENKQVL